MEEVMGNRWWRPGAARLGTILGILLLPLILGAWRDVTGNTINPRYVERIKDGQTSKHEILVLFGDPKEVERTPDGLVFRYVSYKDASPDVSTREREPNPQSQTPFFLDDDKKVRKVPEKKEGKILRSTLLIRFKPDGETVLIHEYQEY